MSWTQEARKKLDAPESEKPKHPVWDHKTKDNVIIGTVKDILLNIPTPNNQYSDTTDFAVVVDEEANTFLTVFLTQKVLKDKWAKLNINTGDQIAIKALGKPEGKDYYDFEIIRNETKQTKIKDHADNSPGNKDAKK